MSTNDQTRFSTTRLAVTVVAALGLVAGCGGSGSAPAPSAESEYDIVTQQQQEALDNGPVPLDRAITEYASKPRSAFPGIQPKASEDESALSGWSFKGAVAAAPGEATMPAECVAAANPMACWGEKLSNSKGCMACHAVDGVKQQPCPNWKGLFGAERPLDTGETVVADEEYLVNSIVNSWDQVVAGYGKTMPPYNFPEEEIDALVAYLISLGEGG